jgi:alpha-tubulin suppressor-like RCC1 family protein
MTGKRSTIQERATVLRRVAGLLAVVTCLTILPSVGAEASPVGTLDGWGYNRYGQVGNGLADQPAVPAPANNTFFSDVVAIDGGNEYSVALRADGTVWAWGHNTRGQLGSQTSSCSWYYPAEPCSPVPVQVPGLSNITAIAAGAAHVLALKSDGTVWAWGANYAGQLGNGTTSNTSAPVQVGGTSPLHTVTAISAGNSHSLALKADGSVWAWGDHTRKQLGATTETITCTQDQSSSPCATTPVQVLTRTDVATPYGDIPVYDPLLAVRAIAAGGFHNLALRSDGTVSAWGANTFGQLGLGHPGDDVRSPQKTDELEDVQAVAAGTEFSLALLSNGSVRAWGHNGFGQLGVGTDTGPEQCPQELSTGTYDRPCSPTPLPVPGLNAVIGLAAGSLHALVVTTDGHVWGWGNDWFGQVGDGDLNPVSAVTLPVRLIEPVDVTSVAAGDLHSFALTGTTRRSAWGSNSQGQLGQDTPRSMMELAAGESHSLAVMGYGQATAWGANSYGQLGDGTTGPGRPMPQPVGDPFPIGHHSVPFDDVSAVAGGARHGLALLASGKVYAWGQNARGQLGDGVGTYQDHYTPVKVLSLSGVVAVSAGAWHNLALKADGTVWAWGENLQGQLGVSTSTPRSDVAVQVAGLKGIVAVAAGRNHSLALKHDGTVWAWGYNAQGQLGDDGASRYSPRQVGSLTGVKAIAAGGWHSAALTASGGVYTWGDNGHGQLGDGTTVNGSAPRRVVTAFGLYPRVRLGQLTGVTAIAVGLRHNLALKANGVVMGWGLNSSGQATGTASSPLDVATTVTGVSKVTEIAAGGSHSLALRAY